MLTLMKGDDTGGTLGKRLALTIDTTIPLTGMTVVFVFCGIRREFTNVKNGDTLTIHFSHNDTRLMPAGISRATIQLVDSAGKIRTLTNTLPIQVLANVAAAYSTEAQSAVIYVRTPVEWTDISKKPFVNRTVNLKTDDDMLAAVAEIIEQLGGTVNA